jgi:hypothetical protein
VILVLLVAKSSFIWMLEEKLRIKERVSVKTSVLDSLFVVKQMEVNKP